jgi:nucleoside-diphosphate-sugar epimerase
VIAKCQPVVQSCVNLFEEICLKILLKLLGIIVGLVLLLVAFVLLTLRPNLPEETFILQPAAMIGDKHVLVFGATGKLGIEIVADLTARGDKVTAFVRETSDRSALEPLGVGFVVGDAIDSDSVLAAFKADEYDAVVTAIAGMRATTMPDYVGNANVFDAAQATGVNRVIMISTVGAGDSYDAAPLISRFALSSVIPLKTQAEDHLKAAGLHYTIVRPGGLPPRGGTGYGILSEDSTTMGFIARADLARLVVGILDDDRTIGKTLAAVDPTLERPWDRGN